MIVKMFQCDNPACNTIAPPEDGGTDRKPATPYGWVHLTGYCQGYGPHYDVTVCTTSCVTPALRALDEAQASR